MKGLALKASERYTSILEFQSAMIEDTAPETQKSSVNVIAPQREELIRKPSAHLETKTDSPMHRDYGSDTKNYRLTGLKIAGSVFVLMLVIGSLTSKKKEVPLAPAVEVPIQRQYIPEPASMPPASPQQVYAPAPQPVYSPPATTSEPDVGRFRYLASNIKGEKFYYDSHTYRMATNGNVQAMTIIVNRNGDVETVHKIDVECKSGIMSIDNGRYMQIESESIGGSMYENFCNR